MENISLVVVEPSEPPKPLNAPETVKSPQPPKPVVSVNSTKPDDLGVFLRLASAGTAGCIADAISYPLDTVKVRLQLQGEGAMSSAVRYSGITGTLYNMAKQEGVSAWYKGIVAGLQRQMAFASIRIGLYENVKNFYMRVFQSNQSSPQFITRVAAGLTTGGCAVLCAQPTDVVKVRLQAQSKAGTVRYLGTMHAYRTIAMEEGVRGMWKGLFPNMARNSIVNVTEVVSYDTIKDFLLRKKLLGDTISCHTVCGFGAGLCTTILASPVDVVKTRYMNSAQNTYAGVFDCAITMGKKEGPLAFYKGCFPAFMRLGTWNILMFVTYEQIKLFIIKTKQNQVIDTNKNTFSSRDGIPPFVEDFSQLQTKRSRYS